MDNNRLDKSSFCGIKVLIYGAGGRQALPMCKGFYKLGCEVTAYCGSKLDTGYLTRYKHHALLYDRSSQKSFCEYGVSFIKSKKYDLVVPIGDEGATFLSKHKKELSPFAKIAVNDWDVFEKVIDKSKTMEICNNNNIPAPITLISDNPLAEIAEGKIKFPVVVKPKTGVGSIGFNIIETREKLEDYLKNYDNSNGPILVQEYIKQGGAPQYGVDVFRDRDGVIRMAIACKVTRWYPIDGGSRLHSISIHDEDIIKSGIDLVNKLNYVGFANMDLVWDEQEKRAKILEVNGRTGASVKLDYLAGIDVARLIVQNEMGYDVQNMLDYKDDKRVSCFIVDVLWFLKSPTRFSTNPSWFCRWCITDLIFSWNDMLPSVGFLITSILGFREAMKKRKRI